MADEKKIKVNIESEADTKPVDDYAAAHERLEETLDESKQSVVDLQNNIERLEEDQRQASEFAEKEAANEEARLNRRANQAQLLVQLANGLQQSSERLKQAGQDIGEFDQELGGTIATMSELGATTANVVAGAAAGFAVGGPIGAAIGGLTGTVKTLYDTWIDGEKMVAEAHGRHKVAVESLIGSLERLGDEQAAGRVSRFQARLEGELKALSNVNAEIRLNLELQAIRDASEDKVRATVRASQTAQIRRDVRDGNTSAAAGSVEIAKLDLEAVYERLNEPVEQFRETVTQLSADIELAEQRQVQLSEASQEMANIVAAAQDTLDSGVFDAARESTRLLMSSTNRFVQKLSQEEIKTEAGLAKLVERGKAEIERLGDRFWEESAAQSEKIDERGEALQKLAELKAGVEKQFAAKVDQKAAEISDTIEQGADDIFKAVIPKIDEAIAESGASLSEQGKTTLASLKGLASDAVADQTQTQEFVRGLQSLQREGVSRSRELIGLVTQMIRESESLRGDVRNLQQILNQMQGG